MPVYNDPEIKNIANYVGLREWNYVIKDQTLLSQDYFGIMEFPQKLTAGKNLIKLKAHPNNLVPGSDINIEVLDSNGNPLYYEPLKYIQNDRSRVIAIWVFPDDAPGPCTIYLAGRALRNTDTGLILPYSRNLENNEYINIPNVLWKRTLPCSPYDKNNTEIIHLGSPRVHIQEVLQPYMKPTNMEDVIQEKSGSGTIVLRPMLVGGSPGSPVAIPSQTVAPGKSITSAPIIVPVPASPYSPKNIPVTTRGNITPRGLSSNSNKGRQFSNPINKFGVSAPFVQGSNSRRSVAPPFGTMINFPQQKFALPLVPSEGGGTPAVEFLGYTSFTGMSQVELIGATPLSESMEGGKITIVNPQIDTSLFDGLIGEGQLEPASQYTGSAPVKFVGSQTLSGSYEFTIIEVQTTTTATVQYLKGVNNPADYLGNGDFQIKVQKEPKQTGNAEVAPTLLPETFEAVNKISASANFTSSHVEPYVLSFTEASQSFAEIIVANMEPATGDVYKMKTQYKPGGMFGEYIDLGDTIVEQTQMLIDPYKMESDTSTGVDYNRTGFFTSLEDFERYWPTTKAAGVGNVQNEWPNIVCGSPVNGAQKLASTQANVSFQPSVLMSGVMLSPNTIPYSTSSNKFMGMHLTSSHHIDLTAGTKYVFDLKAYATDNLDGSQDPDIPLPRLDVYVSGSELTPESGLNDYRITVPYNKYVGDDLDLTSDDFLFNEQMGPFGTRIATYEIAESGSLPSNVQASFRAHEDGKGDIFFIIRRGIWTLARINLRTHSDTGFSPNYVRQNIRIPTRFLKTPLAFKFNFYDYQGTPAEAEPIIFPVTFTGENQYFDGTNNIMTGSLFIGNAISHGVEMAGRNSAYIRAVGFAGYSASLATTNPNKGGFMLYSGSILPEEKEFFTDQPYQGVGFEIVADDDASHLIFSTNPSKLDIKTDSFFLGSAAAGKSFISGSGDGTIGISSSFFHLGTDGAVTMQGTITATAGGQIGGWDITADSIVDTGNIVRLKSNGPYYISSSDFQVDAAGAVTASAGKIAAWEIVDDTLVSAGGYAQLTGSSTPALLLAKNSSNFVKTYYSATDNWGIQGQSEGDNLFQLGSTNQIAGWKFDSAKIISNLGNNSSASPGIVINSNGTIETDPFISGLTANATGWQIRGDGRAEFENAVIRGTLSTAVFEKDTISVVGGQVMVANAAKIDNVNPRYTNYPYMKMTNGVNINFSGETMPDTGSGGLTIEDAASGVVHTLTQRVTASFVAESNLWIAVTNGTGTDANGGARLKIPIATGSDNGNGTRYRISLYSNNGTGNAGYNLFGNGKSHPVMLNGTYAGGGGNLNDGLNILEFSSSMGQVGPGTFLYLFATQGGTGDYKYALYRDIHGMTVSQSLVVDNAGGFVQDEILVAKSTDQGPDGRQGFVREYMRVISSSLGVTETPASGTLDLSGTNSIGTFTNLVVTASKHYTFTGVNSSTADDVANNQYYFVLGSNKGESLSKLKNKIVEEVLDMFVNITGSVPGVTDQLYFQSVGVGSDGNAYGAHTGSNTLKLAGGIPRTKPEITVERNMDARVSGNERGYFIDRIKDGQSLASQGSTGTGYILLNAQPTDDNTPYIDIVERQDASVGGHLHTGDDKESVFGNVATIARIGDLSGITDHSFTDGVSGYGIYTSNGYFKGKLEITNPEGASMVENFGGPSGSTIISKKLIDSGSTSGSQWFTNAGTEHDVRNGVLFVSSSTSGWHGELRSKQTFHKESGHKLVFDMTFLSASSGQNVPRVFIGFGDTENTPAGTNLASSDVYKNNAHAFYFKATDIVDSAQIQVNVYEDNHEVGSLLWITGSNGTIEDRQITTGSKVRGIISPNEFDPGARYQLFKYPNLSQSIVDYNSRDDSDAVSDTIFDVGVWTHRNTETFNIDSFQVTAPGQQTTVIEGDKITTGKLRSVNYGPSFGSEFDLNAGTFNLGGSAQPKLRWDGSTLAITGSIVITSGDTYDALVSVTSSIDNLSDATSSFTTDASLSGSLMYATGGLTTNASTASLQNPASYAFGGTGANSFTLATQTAASGLNLTSQFLGYHDGANFMTYMDSSGNFYLGGTSGALTWNGSTLAVAGEITVTNPQDFADANVALSGSQLYENFGAPLDTQDWIITNLSQQESGSTNADHSPVLANSSSRFVATNADGWNKHVVHKDPFLRSTGTTMWTELIIQNDEPFTMVGFISASAQGPIGTATLNTTDSWAHAKEMIYFYSDQKLRIYHNGDGATTTSHTISNNDAWISNGAGAEGSPTVLSVSITLKPSGGARYEIYKNGDFTSPFTSYETSANTDEFLVPAILQYSGTALKCPMFLQMGVNQGVTPTIISGNTITTGEIKSNNWTGPTGAEGTSLNLSQGILTMRAGSADRFKLDSQANTAKIAGFTFDDTTLSGDGANAILQTSGSGDRIEIGGSKNGIQFYELQFPNYTNVNHPNQTDEAEQTIFDISTEAAGTAAGSEILDSTGVHTHGGQAAVLIKNGASLIMKAGMLQSLGSGTNGTGVAWDRVPAPTMFLNDKEKHDHNEGGWKDAGGSTVDWHYGDWGFNYGNSPGVNRIPSGIPRAIDGATATTYTFMQNGHPNATAVETTIKGTSNIWFQQALSAFGLGYGPKAASYNVYSRLGDNNVGAAGAFEMHASGPHKGVSTTNPGKSFAIWASHYDATGYSFYGRLGILHNNGQIQTAGDVVAFASDKRLKENIVVIENPIEKIKKLRGVHFDWIDKVDEIGFTPPIKKNEIGLIAQEVEKIVPQAVTRAAFDYDANDKIYQSGSRIDGETDPYKTVKMDRIIPLLVEGIKDQQKQIDELKLEIFKLKKDSNGKD